MIADAERYLRSSIVKELVFYVGVGLFFTHELDAMLNHEWRVLPLTSWLTEDVGRTAFVLMHVPLFAVLVALISSTNEIIRNRTWFWLSVFLAIHGLLHAAFTGHERYEFGSLQSNFLIFGAAICGLLYIILNRKTIQTHKPS